LPESLGGSQLTHATHECGHEQQFFVANASITAQIIVMPSRTSIFLLQAFFTTLSINFDRQLKTIRS